MRNNITPLRPPPQIKDEPSKAPMVIAFGVVALCGGLIGFAAGFLLSAAMPIACQ